MDSEIRVIVVGAAGVQGRALIRMLSEAGCTIVGAVGRARRIGEDAGAVAGIGDLGVAITTAESLEELIAETKPDIVIDAAAPDFGGVFETLKLCARCGIDVAELSEEACYPQLVDPDGYKELDRLCRESGATIFATGYQDVAWRSFAMAALATSVNVRSLYGEDWMIVDDFAEIARFLTGSGLTREEFDAEFGNELHLKGFEFVLNEIASEMGWTVASASSSVEFIELENDYYVEKTGETVKAGCAWGSKTLVHLETEEGVNLDGCFYGGYRTQGAEPRIVWRVIGEPGIEVAMTCDDGEMMTATDVVNRLPDILNAPSGFLLIGDMPQCTYKSRPLPSYIKR